MDWLCVNLSNDGNHAHLVGKPRSVGTGFAYG